MSDRKSVVWYVAYSTTTFIMMRYHVPHRGRQIMSNGILEAVEEIENEMVGNDMLIEGERRQIIDATAFCRDATGELIAHGVAISQRGETPEPEHIAVEIEGEGYVPVQKVGEKLESGEWEEPQ